MWTRVNSVVPQHSQGQLICAPAQPGSTQLCGNILQHSQGQLSCVEICSNTARVNSCVGTCSITARINSIVWEHATTPFNTTQKQNKIFENSNAQVMHNSYACFKEDDRICFFLYRPCIIQLHSILPKLRSKFLKKLYGKTRLGTARVASSLELVATGKK